jgi:hypothetical protein
MIWHIFSKDAKLLKGPVIALSAVELLAATTFFFVRSAGAALTLAHTLRVVSSIGAAFLIVALVQQDVIPGQRQDWLIRPIRRRDLLFAKLTFVFLLLIGPKLAADLLEGLANGISFGPSFSLALWRGAWTFVAFAIPWLACSSVFANPVQMMGVSFLLVFFTQIVGTNNEFLNSGMEWISQVGAAAVIFVAAAGGLALTYIRRQVTHAQVLLFLLFFLPFGTARIPWATGFAIQQRLSPIPGAERDVVLTPLPGTEMDAKKRILVTGLAPDMQLHVDKIGRNNDMNQAPFWWDHDQALVLQDLDRGRGTVDYYITLLQVARVEYFPATGGSHGVPGVGRCTTHINADHTAVQLDCLEDAKMPTCYTVNLEHIPTGAHNSEASNCLPDYSPIPDLFVRHNLGNHIAEVKFRQGDIPYPVNESMLPESRLVLRIYEARDHFMRRLTF